MTTLELDGATHWYDDRGEGPPIVFVHGGWSNGDAWTEQVEHFADDHRVIRYDVRGHGRTGGSEQSPYSIELFTDDLERLLDELDVNQPFLCGISLGSMVVQEFLDRYPDRAAGAILAGPVRSMPPADLPGWMKPQVPTLFSLDVSLATMGPRSTFVTFLNGIQATTGERWLSVDPSIRRSMIDSAARVPPREFRKIFMALYDYEPPELSHVSTPVRIIYGEKEAEPVKRQAQDIVEMVDDVEQTEIEGAAHLVNQDAPESFNVVAGNFIRGFSKEWAAAVAGNQ
ncbi:alpha/beta fold hydrolase [Haloarchaeobius sp. TZWWS8]|uniref:alpha/beta fold hydrolase n=1 Tax=Haloarchaeobius sp. TZWWS8 TaxID=3446121 RepID=UPI003EC06FCB